MSIVTDINARGRNRSWRGRLNTSVESIRDISLSRAAIADLLRITVIVAAGLAVHAWNLFNFPRYQGDEGVYMSAAWAVAHGQVFPYTYNYGHPPLGWALIALWCQITGGFFTFGTAINTGRVFMLVVYAVSAIFVYLIARRISKSWLAAALATAFFSFSPLSIYFQREVLLDNIATMWVLIAFYVQIISASRMRYLLASALLFGVAFLSKETMIVFLPVFLYGAWYQTTRFQRRYVMLVYGYAALALVVGFVMVAMLKGELFPTGTLFGGSAPHVSLIATFAQQAARGAGQGSFFGQWSAWSRLDIFLLVGGTLSLVVNVVTSKGQPALRTLGLLPLIYLLFLARGGVTLAYYILPVIPFLALNLAILAYRAAIALRGIAGLSGPFASRYVVLASMLALLGIVSVRDFQGNHHSLTANETAPQVAAMQWMSANVPRSARIIANHYFWLDLRAPGGMGSTYGAPFDGVQMYWVAATDPAIAGGVFHNNWNNIDYVIADSDVMSDVSAFHMTLIQDAIQHAVPIKTFENHLYWVTIYQVRHIDPVPGDNASLADVVTHVTGEPSATLAQSPGAGPPVRTVRVSVADLNVRAGPGLTYQVEGAIPYGTSLQVMNTRDGWIETSVQGRAVWVAGWLTQPQP